MLNKVSKDSIKSSEFSEWSFICQVKYESNQTFQIILNCEVKKIKNDEIIFHEISENNKKGVSLNFSIDGICKLLDPEEDKIFKSDTYALVPIKNEYEKHIHIINRDNTRQVIINDGLNVDNVCLLSQDRIKLKFSKNSSSKTVSISGSDKQTSFSIFDEIISDLNIFSEKIDSKAWNNINCTNNSISIRLYDNNEFTVTT